MATNPHFPDAPAWPQNPDGAAPIGHNRPPVDEMARADFDEALLKERPQFLEKLSDMEGSADRAEVTDDTTLGRAGDLIAMLRAAQKHVDETHRDVKAPYLAAGRAVDAKKNDLSDRINDARAKVQKKGDAFVAKRDAERRAEAQRLEAIRQQQIRDAQAAEQLREEAAAAGDDESMVDVPVIEEIAAAPAKVEPVRSDTGVAVSSKKVWKCEVKDYRAAFAEVADNPKVQEAINKAVASLVRAGKREIPGVNVWPEAQMSAR